MSSSNPVDIIDHMITRGVSEGILHLYTDDIEFRGNIISISGRELVNFGSCSYLGLEFDERLKRGATEAVQRYGTQFSESRAYVSLSLYREAEILLETLFGSPCLITPTTTLGHIANLPVLIADGDAVIMDQQVHSSVQTAAKLVRTKQVSVELVRHNRLDLLEDRIQVLQQKHKRIWYLADGIYSMYGDGCPVEAVYTLLDRYPALHFYVDDAHGMSIWGEHGKGYILNGRSIHPRMVVAVSLAKSFATGGAVMVYPDRDTARRVRTCGGPLITSGPMQPAALGALIAAARIHLSDEIYILQKELHERIDLAKQVIKKHGLPLVSASDAGIFFVGTGLPGIGYTVVREMMDKGFYVNLGIFPAVPVKNTGIRFTITRLHSPEQIDRMISCLAAVLFQSVKDAGFSLERICLAFRIAVPLTGQADGTEAKRLEEDNANCRDLSLQQLNTVADLSPQEWDALLGDRGTFDTKGLSLLEAAFRDNEDVYNNWLFDYIIIRDKKGTVVLATFLTTAIWKDDMLSPDLTSRVIEKDREHNPYHLTSKVVSTGSLLSEGEHLYLDITHTSWKDAVTLLLETMGSLQEQREASSLVLRDFHSLPEDVDTLLTGSGFVRIRMPDTYHKSELGWHSEQEFYESLSRRSRQHFREDIRRYATRYRVDIFEESPGKSLLDHWYELYLAVKNRSYTLNTWLLPRKLFEVFLNGQNWEVIQLTLLPSAMNGSPVVVSFVLCYKTETAYIPMLIGIDYNYNASCKVYRQALYQILCRARALGKQKVFYGFGAGTEKKKLGAQGQNAWAYIQNRDHYNSQVIDMLATGGDAVLYEVKAKELSS